MSGGGALVESNGDRRATVSELAVVEAQRVRELGLYTNDAYLERFGTQAGLGCNDQERPWEAVALGREVKEPERAPYVHPRSFKWIHPGHPEAEAKAELCNAQATEGYKAKNYLLCYEASTEAIRLCPDKVAYYGNRAAAALKLRG